MLAVGKAHLLDYTAHEVPLPLFGLGRGWACMFREAPLPPLGASMSSRVQYVSRLYPNPALAMTGQGASMNFVGIFIDSRLAPPGFAERPRCLLRVSIRHSTEQLEYRFHM